jgi:tetratricopeptide (TPR) repeat protein
VVRATGSREYEPTLYWECVADDCEEAGDWTGAKAAYQQVLQLPDAGQFDRCKALSQLAGIQHLLGEEDDALESFHSASELAGSSSDILARHYYVNEATYLLGVGQRNEARKLVEEALENYDETQLTDHLGIARLLTLYSRCQMYDGELESASESLRLAWEWLEGIEPLYEVDNTMPLGIVGAYARWWQASAKRFELAGDDESAIDALCKARDLATQCAEQDDGWFRYQSDYYQMHVLRELATAYSKDDRFEEASEAEQKADEIQQRRKFP